MFEFRLVTVKLNEVRLVIEASPLHKVETLPKRYRVRVPKNVISGLYLDAFCPLVPARSGRGLMREFAVGTNAIYDPLAAFSLTVM